MNERDRYEVAENTARKSKEFWQGQTNNIVEQIEAHEKTLPKLEPAQDNV